MKAPQLYASPEAQSDARPNRRAYWMPLVRMLCGVIVALMIFSIDAPALVHWIVGLAALTLLVRDGYLFHQRTLPPVMGVVSQQEQPPPETFDQPEPVVTGEEPYEEVVDLDDDEVFVEEAPPRSHGEITQYDERAHVVGFLANSLRALLAVMAVLILVALRIPEDGRSIMMGLGVIAVAALLAFVKLNGGRPALVVAIIAGVCLASVAVLDFMLIVTALLLTYAFAVIVRHWARWFYTRYIVTTKRFRITFKPPSIFFMKDEDPFIALRKVENIETEQSWWEKMFHLNCGTLTVDGAGQKDEMFHGMRYLRDFAHLKVLTASMMDDDEDD